MDFMECGTRFNSEIFNLKKAIQDKDRDILTFKMVFLHDNEINF